jgi:hypothetical protein
LTFDTLKIQLNFMKRVAAFKRPSDARPIFSKRLAVGAPLGRADCKVG